MPTIRKPPRRQGRRIDFSHRRASGVGTALGFASALVVSLAGGSDALAWSDPSRTRIANQAARLVPPALARLIDRHRDELLGAALAEPRDETSSGEHALTPSGKGGAAKLLSRLAREAVEGIERREPMRLFCRRLGRIAHLMADLNHPYHTGDPDLRADASYEDFNGYSEEIARRVPLVFYGWEDDLLRSNDLREFAREISRRSSRDTKPLRDSFYPNGRRVSSQTFDDRSIPFAVASLSYSRAVTDTANAWLYVWNRVGGDLRGTPYRPAVPGGR